MAVLNSLIVDNPLLSCSSHPVREWESDRVSVVSVQEWENCKRYFFQEAAALAYGITYCFSSPRSVAKSLKNSKIS